MPTSRLMRLPTGSRRLAGSPRTPASISGLMALPRLAPSTSASAASGVTNCENASDITSSTTATLECAAQVSAAAMRMHSTGSLVMEASSACTAGACSAGASVSSRMCSAKRISPSPMAMRPIARGRLDPPTRKVTRPITNSTGASAEMSNDSSCTISVVPTLAPSMIASAGMRPTTPSAASEAVISPVAVLDCRSAVSPSPAAKADKRLPSALPRKRRRSGPNARNTPLRTMCRPHSNSATPPIRSSRTSDPISNKLLWNPFRSKQKLRQPSASSAELMTRGRPAHARRGRPRLASFGRP